ncbi:MAG: sigma-70 family RNA polymerase sigma factor [Prevotella sp.]|nr:sigma-70 family RNA polymerase sigma factor [Prevotella sp.]
MTDTGLNNYLDEIGRQQLLSDEQERELSERILRGDERAVSQLVEANLRFVVKLAAQYRGQGLQMDDLVSEGNIGLLAAAAKFDASRGARFVSYAAPYVRQQMERAIDQQNGLYKMPKGASAQERLQSHPLSVDAPLGYRQGMSLLSVLINGDAPQADERVFSEAVERAVEYALQTLGDRDSEVINRFFGLDRERETMSEIAEDLGMKRERVRQIRNHAIRILRKNYRRRLAELRS